MNRRRVAVIAALLIVSLVAVIALSRPEEAVLSDVYWLRLPEGRFAIVESRDRKPLRVLRIPICRRQHRDRARIFAVPPAVSGEITWVEHGEILSFAAAHHAPELLLYVAQDDERFSGLYRRDLRTGQQALIRKGFWLERPAYSPDDEYIAAVEWLGPSSVAGLIVSRRDETFAQHLVPGLTGRRAWTWLNTGNTLAVNSTRFDVDRIDVPSGASRRMSIFAGDPTQVCCDLEASPDDSRLAVLLTGSLGGHYTLDVPSTLAIFDFTTGRLIRQFPACYWGWGRWKCMEWSAGGLCYVAPVADHRLGQLMLARNGESPLPIDVPRCYSQVHWLDERRLVTVDACSGPPAMAKQRARIHEPDSAGVWHTRTVFEAP